MAISLALSLRRARLQKIADAIDAGTAAGRFKLYTGTRPAPGGAPVGALQAEIILNDPCAALHSTDATLIFVTGQEGVRVDTQTITWGRFTDADGNFVIDGDVSATSGSGDFKIDNVNGLLGAVVRFYAGQFGE